MTAAVPGVPAPGRPAARRHRIARALGAVELLLAVPMLLAIAQVALVTAVFALAGMPVALLFVPLLLAGPLLGLGLGTLIAKGQGLCPETGFAVKSLGLLAGTAVEYLVWIRPLGI